MALTTCGPAPSEPIFVERTDTAVDSQNELQPTEAFNIVEYLYYYNGGGVAATDINGDGLPDLYFTNNQGSNKYYINEGNWRFRDATQEGGVAGEGDWSTGVSVVDVNGDGLKDIYVCNVSGYKGLTGRNELFVQQADGSFSEQAAQYGLDFAGFNTQAYWLDYDRDGDLDLYLLRHSVHNDATYGLATAREKADTLAGDLLLRNESVAQGMEISNKRFSIGESRFTDVTEEMGVYSSKIGYGLSAAIADFDRDGWLDIYVCNDFSENDYLYLNQGGERFEEVVRERMGHTSNFSMGSDVGDLNTDGWPDLVSLDMRPGEEAVLKSTASADAVNVYRIKRRAGYYDQLPHNAVQWNRGGGHFSEIGELSGLAATDWSWSVLVEDLTLDGKPEVFIANGIERRPNDLDYLKFIGSALARESSNLTVAEQMPPGYVANQIFAPIDELRYAEVDLGLGYVGSSTGAAVADFDRDGDLDLVLNNVNAPAKLYENRTLTNPDTLGTLSLPNTEAKITRLVDGEIHGLRIDDPALTAGRADYQFHFADGTVSFVAARTQRGFQSQSESNGVVAYPQGTGGGELVAVQRADFFTGERTEFQLDWAAGLARSQKTGTFPRPANYFAIDTTGIRHRARDLAPFDREPLLPFADYDNPRAERWSGDTFLIDTGLKSTTGRYYWTGEELVFISTEGFPTRDPARPESWLDGGTLDTVYVDNGNTTLMAGPFESIRIGERKNGEWKWQSIPESEGLWQSLTTISDDEIIAGNWGKNSVLTAPLRLYHEDLDDNGRRDPLLTYERGGIEYPVADKDELAAQLPGWRRNNLSYSAFSRRSFSESFPEMDAPRQALTLAHHRIRRVGRTWQIEALPTQTQITTLNVAAATPQGLLLGGNTLEVLPRVGRQDAAALQLLRSDGKIELIDLGGELNRAEVRTIVALDDERYLIGIKNGPYLILKAVAS